MCDISNILLLTSNIHSLFDANILKIEFNEELDSFQFIENNSLSEKEKNFLELRNFKIKKNPSLDLNRMKQYILKRNELIK